MESFPDELLVMIFDNLNLEELIPVRLVCSKFANILYDVPVRIAKHNLHKTIKSTDPLSSELYNNIDEKFKEKNATQIYSIALKHGNFQIFTDIQKYPIKIRKRKIKKTYIENRVTYDYKTHIQFLEHFAERGALNGIDIYHTVGISIYAIECITNAVDDCYFWIDKLDMDIEKHRVINYFKKNCTIIKYTCSIINSISKKNISKEYFAELIKILRFTPDSFTILLPEKYLDVCDEHITNFKNYYFISLIKSYLFDRFCDEITQYYNMTPLIEFIIKNDHANYLDVLFQKKCIRTFDNIKHYINAKDCILVIFKHVHSLFNVSNVRYYLKHHPIITLDSKYFGELIKKHPQFPYKSCCKLDACDIIYIIRPISQTNHYDTYCAYMEMLSDSDKDGIISIHKITDLTIKYLSEFGHELYKNIKMSIHTYNKLTLIPRHSLSSKLINMILLKASINFGKNLSIVITYQKITIPYLYYVANDLTSMNEINFETILSLSRCISYDGVPLRIGWFFSKKFLIKLIMAEIENILFIKKQDPDAIENDEYGSYDIIRNMIMFDDID